ncbi:MAG: phosphoenolpyruvate--protein phosphotransferase [Bacteroidota bacterium]
MIAVVLVSHSKPLALALSELVAQMVGPDFPVAVAAGIGDDFAELGTDAVHISEVLRPFCLGDGAVVLMDLGSAVLSAQTALELLEAEEVPVANIRLVAAPLVEAALAASVTAKAGAGLDAVAAEAMAALAPKQEQLGVAPPPPSVAAPVAGDGIDIETEIANPDGLHARPAAALVQALAGFAADITIENLTSERGPASVRSLTAVALVQARRGDRVRFHLHGPDAAPAAVRLRALIADHFGEAALVAKPCVSPLPEAAPDRMTGVSEGVALGRVLPLADALPVAARYRPGTPDEEIARLETALAQVAAQLRHAGGLDAATAAIFAAQALILEDPAVLEPVRRRVLSGEASALDAWQQAAHAVADQYAALDDAYLRARAADLRDIAGRVARALSGDSAPAAIAPFPPAILLVDELLPSEALACRPGAVLGILARRGSSTAHAAILIRGLGIPMIVGIAPERVASAAEIGMDGGEARLWIDPSPQDRAAIAARQAAQQQALAADRAATALPVRSRDGTAFEVLANVASAADAQAARADGADGVGLLRTEFAYQAFAAVPSEDQQTDALAHILAPLGDGPVVVRTPDIGADKPAPYMPPRHEENPFLGVRGLRLSLRDTDFFASNLRAILRAGLGRDLWIMLPMVTLPNEVVQARALLTAAHVSLQARAVPHAWPVRLGIMVEVPAAALTIESFLDKVDFLSVGTNDLTQYLLAAERGNADLAQLQDATHPAVLQVLEDLCRRADAAGCHLSVCGDAASDPAAAALLARAGVRSFSVRPNRIAPLKARIREWTLA